MTDLDVTGGEAEDTKKGKKASDRMYLGADGKEVDTPLDAVGVSYESTAEGWTKTVMFDEWDEKTKNAWAAFGVLTLIGNQTNRFRNAKQGASEEAVVDEWFANLKQGEWVTAGGTVEPGLALVAEGFVRALQEEGGTTFKDGTPLGVDAGKEKLAALTKEERSGIRKDPRVRKAITAIQDERAAKALSAAGTPKVSLRAAL